MAALPSFLGHLRFSAACHAACCPSRVPHLADSGWLPYSCGGRLAWGSGCLGTDVLIPILFSTLCLRNSHFRFFPPFGVLHPCQVRQRVCLQSAGLLLGLGWWGLCYVTWFSPTYHALPQDLRLAQPSQLLATLGFFRSPGLCPSASLVAWLGLQPFPSFSGLLLLCLHAGVVGVLHPVSGCSSCGGVCLVCR